MVFAGLPLATLLSLAAAAGALTVVFYILKLRRRPVAVPFSPIWDRVLRDREATQLFSQLKRWLSLLLQLALLAAMVLALGDPRLAGALAEGRNVVVLVDASASMKANDVLPTRMDAAKAKLREIVSGLGGADRMLVAQMDSSLTPLSTLTGEVADLRRAIDALHATDSGATLQQGLEFARDTLAGLRNAEVVVVTDGALGAEREAASHVDLGSMALSIVPVGVDGKNVAITGFSVRRYPLDKARHEAMLELTNENAEPARVELTLVGDGDVIDVTQLALGPNERLSRFYSDLGGASRTLEARIRVVGSVDHLSADDRAYALMPERRRARVLVVTPGNTYLEAALLLDEYLDVTTVAPSAYPPPGAFDLTLFDGVAPKIAVNGGASLYLNPPKEGAPVVVGRSIQDFGFDTWDRKSALLRWIAPENIQVAKGHVLEPAKGDQVVGASDLGAILVSGRREGRRFVALGFDPRDSDMVLRVAWPLFLLNTIHGFVEEDTRYLSSYPTGEVWQIPVPGDVDAADLRDPAGRVHRVPVKDGHAVYRGNDAGFYELKAGSGSEATAIAFAANLASPDESRIEPVRDLELGGKKAAATSGFHVGVRREIWVYLVLAVLLFSVVEWLTYHRRITV